MTYDLYENSRNAGVPIELYKFTYGIGQNDFAAFTDFDRIITHEAVEYQPRPVRRGEVKTGGGRERQDLTIQLSNKEDFLNIWQSYPPDQLISIIIKGGHDGDPTEEFRTIFAGTVVSVTNRNTGWADVLCRPLNAAGRQSGLRRHYQLSCPHVLYGNQCNATEVPQATNVSFLGTSNNRLTMVGGWNGGFPGDAYVGGYIRWLDADNNTKRRTILSINGNELTLAGSTDGLGPGYPVEAIVGCRHTMDDCGNLHNNIVNFGGQPWIPTKNPVNTNPYI